MVTGKATISFLNAMGTMEERIRIVVHYKNNKNEGIVSDLSEVTAEKMIGLSNFEIQEVKEKISSIKATDIDNLKHNLSGMFPFTVKIVPNMVNVYIVCIAIDSLSGQLPDIYNTSKIEEYNVDKARKILNDFPIRAPLANTVELRSANIIISAYFYSVLTGLDIYILCN